MVSTTVLMIGAGILLLVTIWAMINAWAVTRESPPSGELVPTQEGNVHVIKRGTWPENNASTNENAKRPIVMLHGSTTNALDLDLDLAGRLEDGRAIAIPDRPGHGFSDRLKDGWRLDVQAKAIHEAIEEMGLEQPILLGQSYGGALALRYALEYPDDISGLVLIAPVSHRWPGGVAWYNRVAVNPLYGWVFRHTFIALYGRYGSRRGVAQALRDSKVQSSYHTRTRVSLTFRPRNFRNNAEDIVRLYEQLAGMDDRYPSINVPTEIVCGTHDMTVITSVHGQALADQIPGAHIEIVPGGVHALHHTHPDETVAAVDRLDRRLASGAASPLRGALRRLSAVISSG